MNRVSWDDYFFDLATLAATRSTCLRRQVGAVAVDPHHRIIGTGYNGAPSGMAHCTHETCIREKRQIPSGRELDLCKAIHAEANIVLQLGEKLKDASIYVTVSPCTSCLKLLMGARVARILWKNGYPDEYAHELMKEYGTVTPLSWEMETTKEIVTAHTEDWPGFFSTGVLRQMPGRVTTKGGVLIRKDIADNLPVKQL